jgi:hypothetical protein
MRVFDPWVVPARKMVQGSLRVSLKIAAFNILYRSGNEFWRCCDPRNGLAARFAIATSNIVAWMQQKRFVCQGFPQVNHRMTYIVSCIGEKTDTA